MRKNTSRSVILCRMLPAVKVKTTRRTEGLSIRRAPSSQRAFESSMSKDESSHESGEDDETRRRSCGVPCPSQLHDCVYSYAFYYTCQDENTSGSFPVRHGRQRYIIISRETCLNEKTIESVRFSMLSRFLTLVTCGQCNQATQNFSVPVPHASQLDNASSCTRAITAAVELCTRLLLLQSLGVQFYRCWAQVSVRATTGLACYLAVQEQGYLLIWRYTADMNGAKESKNMHQNVVRDTSQQ